MNFRIIAHLVRSDWQRLKRPLAWLWLFLIAAALPWLLHDPGDWKMPQWTRLGWSGDYPPNSDFSGLSRVIFLVEILGTILALILAAMLGAQWTKHPVTPVRSRERLTALALSLLVFIVVPQGLLAASNLLLQGFSPAISIQAAAATALTAWMLLGLFAAFGAWLSSPWLLLAGCAAVASSVGFISEIHRPLDFMLRGLPTLPLLPAGPREWLFGGLAIALLTVFFPLFRRRLNGPWKVAIATLLVLVAGIPAVLLPPPASTVRDASVATAPVRPVLDRVQIQVEEDSPSSDASRLLISGNLSAAGNRPSEGIRFEPTSGWISQNGKRVATIRPKTDPYSSAQDEVGYFTPSPSTLGVNSAAWAALPGGPRVATLANSPVSQFITLGQSELATGSVISPDQDAELHMEFTATVFRYEVAWNTAVSDQTSEIRDGNLTWRVRRFDSTLDSPHADVLCTHPALGISQNPDQVRWDTLPLRHYRLFFHLPKSGTHLDCGDNIFNASGPLYSGAGWERQVVTTTRQDDTKRDLTDLRLIALRPVAIARFTTSTVTRFRPWRTGDTSDFDLAFRYSIGAAAYRRDWFPKRPDPLTCTREAFARWLRVGAHVFPGSSGSEYDLADFAPRFAGLMAKVGYHESVEDALRLGTPEGMKDEVIGKIGSVERPDRLAEVALARGWLAEARDSILGRFNDGGMWRTDAVMALEDPSTYPELISRFLSRPTRETYENLRLLPGIEPLLGDAISKATQEMNPEFLKDNLSNFENTAPYGPFLYAAKRGDADALETVIKLYQSRGDMAEFAPRNDLGYIVEIPAPPGGAPKPQMSWLRGKSAASFRFDPLLRIWKPLP